MKSNTLNTCNLSNEEETDPTQQYKRSNDGFFYNKKGCWTPITNFTAWIEEELTVFDGTNKMITYRIQGRLSNKPLPIIEIPASRLKYGILEKEWGADIIIYPEGRKHISSVIKSFSSDITNRTVMKGHGWRNDGKHWFYAHAEGIISSKRMNQCVDILPAENMRRYCFPQNASTVPMKKAISASLEYLNVAPPEISYPLLASVFRSTLAEISPCDFSLFLTGGSGIGKSELAALAQQHFGVGLDSRHFLGSWSSTANSLEKLAWNAKDTVLVIDDYCEGQDSSTRVLNSKADRIIRSAGNQVGKDRLNLMTSEKLQWHPRGLIISTGEMVPRGDSLRGRTLTLYMKRGDVDWRQMSRMQEYARQGLLVRATAGFIEWVSGRWSNTVKEIEAKEQTYRKKFKGCGPHSRTPDILAKLYVGFELFAAFAKKQGVFTHQEMKESLKNAETSFRNAVSKQGIEFENDSPAIHFINVIRESIEDGAVCLQQINGSNTPTSTVIGYTDEEGVYLKPQDTWKHFTEQTKSAGLSYKADERRTWAELERKDYLLTRDKARGVYAKRKQIHGKRADFLHLKKDLFFT